MNWPPISAKVATRPSFSQRPSENGRSRALVCSMAGDRVSVAESGLIAVSMRVSQELVSEQEIVPANSALAEAEVAPAREQEPGWSGRASIHGMTLRPGSSDQTDFADEYARMGDAELLKIAAAYDSLVEPAKDALRAELRGARWSAAD